MTIREVMTKNPVPCTPSSSAQTAALVMQQKDTGIVPVTEDVFSRKLVGVVTDRDLCLRWWCVAAILHTCGYRNA